MHHKKNIGVIILSYSELILGFIAVLFFTQQIRKLIIYPGGHEAFSAIFCKIIMCLISGMFLITGVLTFKMKSIGRIMNLILFTFLLIISILSIGKNCPNLNYLSIMGFFFIVALLIFVLFYLNRPGVKKQFKKENRHFMLKFLLDLGIFSFMVPIIFSIFILSLRN